MGVLQVDAIHPNSRTTALMFAAMEGRNNVIHILCLAGASLKKRDVQGLTALHFAAQ